LQNAGRTTGLKAGFPVTAHSNEPVIVKKRREAQKSFVRNLAIDLAKKSDK